MQDLWPDLVRVGELAGIEKSYQDGQGVWHQPSLEAYLAILASLGVPVQKPEDATAMRRSLALERMQSRMEDVQTVWAEGPAKIQCPILFQVGLDFQGAGLATLVDEDGNSLEFPFRVEDCPALDSVVLEGKHWVRRILRIPSVPVGFYSVSLDIDTRCGCWLIVAPRLAHQGSLLGRKGKWGIFLPVHAMRSADNNGCGTYSDLSELLDWTHRHGGGLVGTLPLLAGLTENPCEPSPYAPASRLFWNELYLDLALIPELSNCPEASAWMESAAWRQERQRLRSTELVDHEGVMRLVRPILTKLAEKFPETGPRSRQLEDFQRDSPLAMEYATFRAKHDLTGKSWHGWPSDPRLVAIEGNPDFQRLARNRLIWQFWAEEQVSQLALRARKTGGPGLYLDLPLGVHGDGFDVFRFGESFAPRVSAGAPPDSFFTLGQDWGFPPPHPQKQRKNGYQYLRGVLDHHMRLAGLLRIDHVMGLHRLYWVPWGLGAKQGAYVRYPAEELYALFCLASQKHACSLAGEDLGTVPPAVRPEMEGHGIHRLYVGQFSFRPDSPAMDTPPPNSIGSMNTHDLPTFKAFWEGLDIRDRYDLGLINELEVESEKEARRNLRAHVLQWLEMSPVSDGENQGEKIDQSGLSGDATLQVDSLDVLIQLTRFLEKGQAAAVLVNAEDAWLSPDPQNVPGTWKERPNWRRKAAFAVADWDRIPGIRKLVEGLGGEI